MVIRYWFGVVCIVVSYSHIMICCLNYRCSKSSNTLLLNSVPRLPSQENMIVKWSDAGMSPVNGVFTQYTWPEFKLFLPAVSATVAGHDIDYSSVIILFTEHFHIYSFIFQHKIWVCLLEIYSQRNVISDNSNFVDP